MVSDPENKYPYIGGKIWPAVGTEGIEVPERFAQTGDPVAHHGPFGNVIMDGFRMDVINYISKEEGLPQGDEVIGNMMGFPGIEKYYYGPNLHKYLKEVQERAFAPHQAFSVGETPGVGMKMCQLDN